MGALGKCFINCLRKRERPAPRGGARVSGQPLAAVPEARTRCGADLRDHNGETTRAGDGGRSSGKLGQASVREGRSPGSFLDLRHRRLT
ncbi:uncharacterized protein SOCE26_036480 [Sorangium cellulosum]|uniref:Uncharacterized protein n=1 Tax=Sorangium cellulosum TaxID=56 RepID=A0A2L0ESE4_SORCE|nr:uncharacterized protein SOCE26_036480 [Sorangium cellulosum]